jgi:hypothetical protein
VFFFSFLVGLGFELRASGLAKQAFYCLSHTSSPFYSGYFGGRVSQIVCPGWPQIEILLILASQVARITGVSIGA